MNSKSIFDQKRTYRQNSAKKTSKSYCLNRSVICTIPKFGGNASWNPLQPPKNHEIRITSNDHTKK